jgi:hypothetical protein
MSALSIQPTFPIFTDIDGQPLEAGYVWIGTANLDPQTNPINVYWDAALTIAAPQPIRTLAGYPSNNGTPGRLYVGGDYSIRVMNKNGSTVYSAPQATERISSDLVTYQPPFAGGVATTIQDKLAQTVSVKDFGAVGDGVTDDTAAIQTAINAWIAGNVPAVLVFPAGKYKITSELVCSPAVNIVAQKALFGYGAEIVNQSPTKAIKFITTVNRRFWANAVIEGLTVRGGVNCFSFEAGGPANQDWMWQFTLKNLNAFDFSGVGFYGYDGFFESAFYSCAAWALNSNVTGYGYKFENGPSSVISSIDIYNANTRRGLHGIYTVSPVVNVNIYGGTFLEAYEEGIRFGFAAGNVISGPHVEDNFQSGSGSIRAGIRYSGSATVIGVQAQSRDATKQNYAVNIFAFQGSVVFGGNDGGVGHTAFGYYASGTGATDSITTAGVTFTQTSTARVINSDGNGFETPMLTLKNNFVAYAASVTPNLNIGTYFRVGSLTGDIAVDNPTFSGTVQVGSTLVVALTQDGVGGRTVTWGSDFAPKSAINTSANNWSFWTFMWEGARWRETAFA